MTRRPRPRARRPRPRTPRPLAARPSLRAAFAGLLLTAAACREPEASTAPEGVDASTVPDAPEATDPPAALRDPSAPRPKPAPVPVHGLSEAEEALARGNAEGAREFLESQAEKEASSSVWAALARARWMTGDYEPALAAYATALEQQPGPELTIALELERIDALAALGRRDEIDRRLDAALATHPDRIELRGRRLAHWMATGRGEGPEARTLMESLYDDFDAGRADSAAELWAVAQAAVARGSTNAFKDASWVLEEAEKLAPVSDGSPLADAIMLYHAGIFAEKYADDEAEASIGMILERNPWHPTALAQLAEVQLSRLRLSDAQRLAREALLVDPHQPDAHAVLARIDTIEGERDAARQRIQSEVLSLNPHHPEGLAVASALALFEDDPAAHAQAESAAQAWHPGAPGYYTSLADLLGFLHLYPEADRVLTRARELNPEDPYVASAFGLNRLRLGDEREGRAAVDAAYARDKYNERTLNTRELYAERIDPHYRDHQQGDLWLRVPREGADFLLPPLYSELAKARRTLDHHYGVDPGVTRFEVFDRPEDFGIRTVGVPGLGALGVCFGPVITAIGPYTASHNFYMVAWHELAHVYAIELSRGRVPRWFTEGLSEWEASNANPAWTRRSSVLLRVARREGRGRKLSELELAFVRAGSSAMMEVAYMTAAYAMRYLGETYGRAKLIEMLRGYGRGATTAELMPKILGKDLPLVEAEFETWLDAELERALSGWSPNPRRKNDALNKRFEAAMRAAAEKDFDEAARLLQAMIQDGGDGFEVRVLLGRVLMEGPGRASARSHLERAATYNREDPTPFALLANLARDEGDARAELESLRKVLALDPVAFEANASLLALALALDDASGLTAARRRCEAIAPLHPACLAGAAVARHGADPKSAAAHFEQAMVVRQRIGKDPTTTASLALSAARLGQKARARELAAGIIGSPELSSSVLSALEGLAK